eukprot:TRINITY_DN17946_c0_g1_i1.p1 TRINITY_DN17946_c0_g1~~TRINITY_DN17946_c0_g1_i1.p1  ORF type:complete len:372 (+),score=91.06 TRINITY_DN17946_c0_g1_i1:87-1202(+)
MHAAGSTGSYGGSIVDVTITIPGPGEVDGPRRVAQHAEYCVILRHASGATHKRWHRYSEFRRLLSEVRTKAAGVPPPPPKKLFGNQHAPELLAARAARLQHCLRSAAAAPELKRCSPLFDNFHNFIGITALKAECEVRAREEDERRLKQRRRQAAVADPAGANAGGRERLGAAGAPRASEQEAAEGAGRSATMRALICWRDLVRDDPPDGGPSAPPQQIAAECHMRPVLAASPLPDTLREEPAESPCSSPVAPCKIPVCGEAVLDALQWRPPTPPLRRPSPNAPPPRRELQSAMRGGRRLPRTPYVREMHVSISCSATAVVTSTDVDNDLGSGSAAACKLGRWSEGGAHGSGGGRMRRALAAVAALLHRRR